MRRDWHLGQGTKLLDDRSGIVSGDPIARRVKSFGTFFEWIVSREDSANLLANLHRGRRNEERSQLAVILSQQRRNRQRLAPTFASHPQEHLFLHRDVTKKALSEFRVDLSIDAISLLCPREKGVESHVILRQEALDRADHDQPGLPSTRGMTRMRA
jgi:hypothetical protein